MQSRSTASFDRPGEEQGATPEALAGIFPFTYDATPEVEQATYAFYLDLANDYVGSPMLSALLPTYAARLLPRGWDGIEVERLRVRGRAATLSARHGAHAVLEIDD